MRPLTEAYSLCRRASEPRPASSVSLDRGDLDELDRLAERRGELELAHLLGLLDRVERERRRDVGRLAVDLDGAGVLRRRRSRAPCRRPSRRSARLAALAWSTSTTSCLRSRQVARHVLEPLTSSERLLDLVGRPADVGEVVAGDDRPRATLLVPEASTRLNAISRVLRGRAPWSCLGARRSRRRCSRRRSGGRRALACVGAAETAGHADRGAAPADRRTGRSSTSFSE